MTVRRREGDVLVGTGDDSGTIYLLESGWVARTRMIEDGRRQIIVVFLPGDLMGIKSMLLERQPDTIECLTDVHVRMIDRLHLLELVAQDHAAMENFGGVAWLLYSRSYLYATRVLTLFIVQLTVLIFGVAASPLPLLLDTQTTGPIVAGAVVGLVAIVLVVLLALKVEPPSPAKSWWFGLIPAFAVGFLTWWALSCHSDATALVLLAEWWVLGSAICILIFLQYDKVRAGSREFGAFFIVLLTVVLGLLILQQGSLAPESLRTAAFSSSFWLCSRL